MHAETERLIANSFDHALVLPATFNYRLLKGFDRGLTFASIQSYPLRFEDFSGSARWSAKNNPITGGHESPADRGGKSNPFLDLRLI